MMGKKSEVMAALYEEDMKAAGFDGQAVLRQKEVIVHAHIYICMYVCMSVCLSVCLCLSLINSPFSHFRALKYY